MEDKHFADIENHWAKAYIVKLVECGIIPRMSDALFRPEDNVTTEEFVAMIMRCTKAKFEPNSSSLSSQYMDCAIYKGIIEDYDISNRSKPIERRSVARIVHEVLITEFGESDEKDWSAAENLRDLYSCHTCVMHIAQVYVKGILPGRANSVFDAIGSVTRAEAAAVVVRMLDREQRIPRIGDRVYQRKTLSPDEAWELMLNDTTAKLVDVRTNEEYRIGHIQGSICIPLQAISDNPSSVCNRKDIPFILYCQKGYKSTAAAQILTDAGYSRIYTIPGIEQYPYHLATSWQPL